MMVELIENASGYVPGTQTARDLEAMLPAVRGSQGSPLVPGVVRSPREAVPTRASLREILGRVLRSDADFEAFVGDYFSKVSCKLGGGMDRIQKTNVLLTDVEPGVILGKLRKAYPSEVARREDEIEWEPEA